MSSLPAAVLDNPDGVNRLTNMQTPGAHSLCCMLACSIEHCVATGSPIAGPTLVNLGALGSAPLTLAWQRFFTADQGRHTPREGESVADLS